MCMQAGMCRETRRHATLVGPPEALQADTATPIPYHPAGSLPSSLSYAQAAVMLVLGLQRRPLEDCESELGLPAPQVRTF